MDNLHTEKVDYKTLLEKVVEVVGVGLGWMPTEDICNIRLSDSVEFTDSEMAELRRIEQELE